MNKVVLFDNEAREKILQGVKKISAAVKVTLGASGKCVLISNAVHGDYQLHQLPILVTKDGYTVTKHFNLSDPIENVGAKMIKDAAQKTVYEVGDGTTTTTVLAEALIETGIEYINSGINSLEIKKDIDAGVESIINKIKAMAVPVRGDIEKVRQIATVSANNDTEIGDLIAEAVTKIGDDGVIDIETSKTSTTSVTVDDGFKFDKGVLKDWFITNRAKNECELIEPYIFLFDRPITTMKAIAPILQKVVENKKPILIICDDMDGEALALLTMNVAERKISACVVQSPQFNNSKKETMDDIAAVTGATYVSNQAGIDIENVQLKHLGTARKVVISKDSTIIIGGDKNKEEYDDLFSNLKMNLVDAKTEEEKEALEKRIARLQGGVAVISVGGATEVEMGERRDRVEDAVRATKAAIAEGYVPGGGTAFVKCFVEGETPGEKVIYNAILRPMLQICENAGKNGEDYLPTIKSGGINIGYNVKTDKVEDMVTAGVIDPVKALRCSLINAASVAGMVLTSQCLIADTF